MADQIVQLYSVSLNLTIIGLCGWLALPYIRNYLLLSINSSIFGITFSCLSSLMSFLPIAFRVLIGCLVGVIQLPMSPPPLAAPIARRLSISASVVGEEGLYSCVLPEDVVMEIIADRIQVTPLKVALSK